MEGTLSTDPLAVRAGTCWFRKQIINKIFPVLKYDFQNYHVKKSSDRTGPAINSSASKRKSSSNTDDIQTHCRIQVYPRNIFLPRSDPAEAVASVPNHQLWHALDDLLNKLVGEYPQFGRILRVKSGSGPICILFSLQCV